MRAEISFTGRVVKLTKGEEIHGRHPPTSEDYIQRNMTHVSTPLILSSKLSWENCK